MTCLFTTVDSSNNVSRVRIEPDDTNNLKAISFVMVDKVFSFDKSDLDKPIGRLSDDDMELVSEKLRGVRQGTFVQMGGSLDLGSKL